MRNVVLEYFQIELLIITSGRHTVKSFQNLIRTSLQKYLPNSFWTSMFDKCFRFGYLVNDGRAEFWVNYLGLLSRTFINNRTAEKGGGRSVVPHYHFHPLHRHLDISRAITAESSPPHIASRRTRTGNLWFRAQVANQCRECGKLNTRNKVRHFLVLEADVWKFLVISAHIRDLVL